ncbi:MAG: ATP-binding protein [Candidatus Promineifilaceae bacterium]|nr:ATP-binding protein [Candidatus Promineifilaceae bacterium]
MKIPFNRADLPLRARLTIWYLLTLAAILLLFLSFLYWQVQRSLQAQMDAALRLTAAQATGLVTAAPDAPTFAGASVGSAEQSARIRELSDDFVIYLLGPEGAVQDWLGEREEFDPLAPAGAPEPGLATTLSDNDRWRVYTERLVVDGATAGWLQVAQEMDPVSEPLASLRAQMVLGLPLALLLAGLGGFFLASRALRPIERITDTAQAINAGDLSRRIHYAGPPDEVGRLAATFDGMLDRLQAAFERERRFTGDAAHELRTPLTALKGRIEVTLSRQRPAETYRQTLEEMGTQVERLIRLSNDLLFMTRLDRQEPGRPVAERERVAVDDLLAAVVDQMRPLAARNGVTLALEAEPGLVLQGDLDLLIRLFLNLLDNAVKYTPAGGRVTVRGGSVPDGVRVEVADTGPGISAEHLPHLFERFYRAESDRARGDEGGGAGLGLAIAAEIARMHGGRIRVESELGAGTLFTVTLPDSDEY